MSLLHILRNMTNEAAAVACLESSGDERLLSRVRATAPAFEEDAAQYVAGAMRRYSHAAGNEEWLALMTALGGSDDPGRTCLRHILEWALMQDAAELRREPYDCASSGPEART